MTLSRTTRTHTDPSRPSRNRHRTPTVGRPGRNRPWEAHGSPQNPPSHYHLYNGDEGRRGTDEGRRGRPRSSLDRGRGPGNVVGVDTGDGEKGHNGTKLAGQGQGGPPEGTMGHAPSGRVRGEEGVRSTTGRARESREGDVVPSVPGRRTTQGPSDSVAHARSRDRGEGREEPEDPVPTRIHDRRTRVRRWSPATSERVRTSRARRDDPKWSGPRRHKGRA